MDVILCNLWNLSKTWNENRIIQILFSDITSNNFLSTSESCWPSGIRRSFPRRWFSSAAPATRWNSSRERTRLSRSEINGSGLSFYLKSFHFWKLRIFISVFNFQMKSKCSRNIPFESRRPTMDEVKRVWERLGRVFEHGSREEFFKKLQETKESLKKSKPVPLFTNF